MSGVVFAARSLNVDAKGIEAQIWDTVRQESGAEQKADISEEEVKSTLGAVASTGKFWQDWEKLKGTLSCWLKKVLSEYPEAKMTDEQQKEALGETYSELVSRLDETLLSFDEGPPFTLQRLCEIQTTSSNGRCLRGTIIGVFSYLDGDRDTSVFSLLIE